MKDLIDVLMKARRKMIFKGRCDFVKHLDMIKFSDDLHADWDDGAGEEWARISHKDYGIVYMMNVQIGILFVKKNYANRVPKAFHSRYEVVYVDNYNDDEWSVDVKRLKNEIPELDWHTSEDAVNPNSFSLNDLYFATV